METLSYSFADLFEQLGLPSDEESIRCFCADHHLADEGPLPDAPFWTPAQSQFLREQWHDDSAWIVTIDQLNASLRKLPDQPSQ